MKISAQIILFLLLLYGASTMTPTFILTEKKEKSSSPLSFPQPIEQSSDAKDNFSSEDENFIDFELIYLSQSECSGIFHYSQNFSDQDSPNPPFSPPELQSC